MRLLRGAWLIVAIASWVATYRCLQHIGGFDAGMFRYDTGEATSAFWYSLPVLTILAAHEFGHYFAARRYQLRPLVPMLFAWPLSWVATLPLFTAAGTAGAYVPVPRLGLSSALVRFDVAFAGVAAGAVATAVWTVVGYGLSVPAIGIAADFWSPGVFHRLTEPAMSWHPSLYAARIGWIVTAANLLPLPPLDGWRLFDLDIWPRRAAQVVTTVGLCLICWL